MENSRSVGERTPYEQQQFLDVGCGCGRVTKELLWPSCPKNIRRIVGVDICANMVSYARKHSAHPKIFYEQLDIAGDISNFLHEFGTFHRVYSFNSLNRVKEQAMAWKNISSLLKPGGECLLFYSAWYATPDIWRELAKREKWRRFSELWESMIPATQDMDSTEERLKYARSLADNVGLVLRSCEMTNLHPAPQQYEDVLAALIPGLQSLAPAEQEMLTRDAREEMQKWLKTHNTSVLVQDFAIHALKPALQSAAK
ncbi:juvenile hormone acid O-methyltransferase-like [Haemaphysalis longicornis]